MSEAETVLKSAMELSPTERAQLVGSLIATLPAVGAGAPSPSVTRLSRPSVPSAMPPASDETCITWEGVQGFLED